MAKDITIQQAGTAENYSGVAHIKVPDESSGDIEFVPVDEHTTMVKVITENGTYSASEDNVYGYRAVIVNIPLQSVTGVNPSDGKQYKVVRDENGNLLYIPVGETTELET